MGVVQVLMFLKRENRHVDDLLTELGFRQGGTAGYGLRRLLVDQDGKAKGVLRRGEQKRT